MTGFTSIKGVKVSKALVKKLQRKFPKWSMFAVGKTRTNITDSGGIHFTGKLTLTNCITFEIRRGKTYVMVSLFEYPKGLIFHAHIYYPDIYTKSKQYWETVVEKIYIDVKNAIESKDEEGEEEDAVQ